MTSGPDRPPADPEPAGPPARRRSASGPDRVGDTERAAFEALVTSSLPAVRASAQTWRNGLTALITLVTAGIVIQGRTGMADLATGWRAAITLLIGGGLAVAVAGLWQTLSAEAGSRADVQTLAGIHARHASVAAYQVALAGIAGRHLRRARVCVAVALALLVSGVVTTWWAPRAARPPAYVRVVDLQGAVVCGAVRSADGGMLRLTVAGAHEPAVVPLSAVRNLAVVARCA